MREGRTSADLEASLALFKLLARRAAGQRLGVQRRGGEGLEVDMDENECVDGRLNE